jgi:NDP-sugar pyrophosphorylase family protein
MQVIILAGGKGTRLKPFTSNIPKPLVPVGDKPILEYVLVQLKHFGFKDVVLAVNHLAELIMSFAGDGRKWGLNIKYSLEDEPLGTAGPLSMIEDLEDNFLVMNGDLLTTINYKDFYDYHCSQKNAATISTYKRTVNIDYGVLHTDGSGMVMDYIEKPEYHFHVSAGLNMLNKEVVRNIPPGKKYDIPDLIKDLVKQNCPVGTYYRDYYWLDIGRISDYETAIEIIKEREAEFLCNG